MILTAILGTAIAATLPAQFRKSWAEFSRKPALRRSATTVEIGTLGFNKQSRRPVFWARRTVVQDGVTKVSWADSRSCHPMQSSLVAMREIPQPKFSPPGIGKGPPLILDGVSYTLRTYSDEGILEAKTNVGTPLAEWIDASLKDWESCWTTERPEVPKR